MKHQFLLLLLPLAFTSHAQEFALDIQNKSVNEFLQYEENAGSTKIEGRIVHIAGDMAYPLFYERQQDGILNLEVMYQFKRDSLMQSARYIWDDDQAEMDDARKKEFMLATAKKFNELEKMITKQYGPGKPQGDMSDFSKADTRAGMRKNSTWKLDSGQVITLEGVISNYYEEVGLLSTPTIRYNCLLPLRNKA